MSVLDPQQGDAHSAAQRDIRERTGSIDSHSMQAAHRSGTLHGIIAAPKSHGACSCALYHGEITSLPHLGQGISNFRSFDDVLIQAAGSDSSVSRFARATTSGFGI